MTEVKQDLLIVTDEGDFLRKQALRMIYALQNVYPDYTAEVRRFSDHRYIPELINFSSKKLVFLTWGYDSYQKLYTTKFLKSSTVRSNNDRLMLTLTKDLDGKPIDILDVHFDEFNDKNRMSVNNIRLVDTWWPQMVAFLFDITASPICKPKWEYHTRTVSEGEKLVKCVDVVKTCMDFFHVKINSQPVPKYRGCNVVLCSGNFPQGENETDGCVYISDSYMATETMPDQYNKEHWLAGVLRIYSKTGVVKKPFKEAVKDKTRRALGTCTCGIKILSKTYQLQGFLLFFSLPLCVFGTGLPYWNGLIMKDKVSILYGLFNRCQQDHTFYSGKIEDCAMHDFDLPGWWQLQIALCFLVMILLLAAFVLCCLDDYKSRSYSIVARRHVVTSFNLAAGFLYVVIFLIWEMCSEDFICTIENCNITITNELHASFYMFMAIVILYTLWIIGACTYNMCCKAHMEN